MKTLLSKAHRVLDLHETLSPLCSCLVLTLCSFSLITITLFSYSGLSLVVSGFGPFHVSSSVVSLALLFCYTGTFFR